MYAYTKKYIQLIIFILLKSVLKYLFIFTYKLLFLCYKILSNILIYL